MISENMFLQKNTFLGILIEKWLIIPICINIILRKGMQAFHPFRIVYMYEIC